MPHKSTLLQFKYDNQIMGKSHHTQSNNPRESLSLQLPERLSFKQEQTNLANNLQIWELLQTIEYSTALQRILYSKNCLGITRKPIHIEKILNFLEVVRNHKYHSYLGKLSPMKFEFEESITSK